MPLVGVTDTPIEAYLPSIGTLHKGAEKGERGPGKDLDCFRFTSTVEGAAKAFEEYYGTRPSSVAVIMPFDTPDRCFETGRIATTPAGKLLHVCDGRTMSRWLGDDGAYHTEPKPCAGKCKQFGKLQFFVPELVACGYAGLVTLHTGSWNDIRGIWATLSTVYARTGSLTGMQFILRRVKRKLHYKDDGGSDRTVEKWLVLLQPTGDWVSSQISAAAAELEYTPDDENGDGEGDGVPDDKGASEPEGEPEPSPGPSEKKTEKLTRPASPEALRSAMAKAIAYYQGKGQSKAEPANQENLTLIWNTISDAAGGLEITPPADYENEVVAYLTEGYTVGDLEDAHVTAMLAWLMNETGVHPAVPQEVGAILATIAKETAVQETASADEEIPW